MIKNYFKTAWRNIIRGRFYSLVNIIGLSTGIAFTLLIGAYVWSELQVNESLKNTDRQYIIQSKWKNQNEGEDFTSPGALAKALRESYPGLVANYYRWDGITSNVSNGNDVFREDISICDSTMLKMYGFPLLYGNPATALNEPFSVVLTRDMAIKYFGKTDVIGKSLTIENFSGARHDFIITGVLNSYPKNSVTDLIDGNPNKLFVSTSNLSFFGRNMNWSNPHIASYVELKKGVNRSQLIKPMKHLIKENASPQFNADLKLSLVLLKDYYLDSNNGLVKKMLYELSAIAVFILIMACINFINISISKCASRMKEIGLRKVLGGMKRQLILQFLIESMIIVFIATLFAIFIYILNENLFSNILGTTIPSLDSFPVSFIAFPLLFIIVIGFIAGIYPSFVLSSLKPVESLKGKLISVQDHVKMRRALIGLQFGIAVIAFIGAIVITKQIDLFLQGNLGYNKNFILSAQLPRNWTREGVDKMETIRDQFASMPFVKDVSLSFEIPDGNNSNDVPIYKLGTDSTQAVSTKILENDEKFLSVYQIPLVAGSPFEGHRLDSLKVILNQTAVKALGWSNANDAIGKQVKIPGNPAIYTVKGVTNDFHFGSMEKQTAPIIMFNLEYDYIYRFLSFKIRQSNIAGSVDALRKKWASLLPGSPFEYKFMDETLLKMYQPELQLKKASYAATILALIIVLLGVLGLVSLGIQKRTKEIGIRKVLGSSVAEIMSLFMKEFFWVILISGVVACPVAYIIMNKWLQEYAYRINITPAPFVVSVFVLGIITSILICVQTVKAARANPVKSLRSE
ncbi:MAG: ABC transporter permease [Ginsengibacter sp.]